MHLVACGASEAFTERGNWVLTSQRCSYEGVRKLWKRVEQQNATVETSLSGIMLPLAVKNDATQ